MENIPASEIFRIRTEKLYNEKTTDCVIECKTEVLLSMLSERKKYFPVLIVEYDVNYEAVYYIGNFEDTHFCYSDKYNSVFICLNHLRVIYEEDITNVTWRILAILENFDTNNYFHEKVFIPKGFYLFRYDALIIARMKAKEGEEIICMSV